ncbi:MAG: ABC transporter permease subunit [Nitrososphaerales archaeon]
MNWLKIISYFTLALLIVPVLLLLYEGFGPLRTPVGYSYAVFRSIELSLLSSALAALISIAVFTPLAYYLARNQNKLGETLADIPAIVPHPIIGVALLVLASPLTPFGQFLLSIGINLFNTILGLVLALTIVSAPIYIKSIQPYFQSMNVAHENYALGLGASKLKTYVSVVLPNSGRGIATASLISMSRAMSEFGSIAIIAYYVLQAPFFGVNPASVLIFQYYSFYGLGAAVTASAVMILVSFVIMIGLRFVRWR